MRDKLILLFIFFSLITNCFADGEGSSIENNGIQSIKDTSTETYPWQVIVTPNGGITDNGDGTTTLSLTGAVDDIYINEGYDDVAVTGTGYNFTGATAFNVKNASSFSIKNSLGTPTYFQIDLTEAYLGLPVDINTSNSTPLQVRNGATNYLSLTSSAITANLDFNTDSDINMYPIIAAYYLISDSFTYGGNPYNGLDVQGAIYLGGGEFYTYSELTAGTIAGRKWDTGPYGTGSSYPDGTTNIDVGLYFLEDLFGGDDVRLTVYYMNGQKANLESFFAGLIPAVISAWTEIATSTSLFTANGITSAYTYTGTPAGWTDNGNVSGEAVAGDEYSYKIVLDASTGDVDAVGDLTIGAGNKTGSITAFAAGADQWAGYVVVTSAAHDLTAYSYVTISGTTNYNGKFFVQATPTTDTFVILDTWVSDDATGTWTRPYGQILAASDILLSGGLNNRGNTGKLWWNGTVSFGPSESNSVLPDSQLGLNLSKSFTSTSGSVINVGAGFAPSLTPSDDSASSLYGLFGSIALNGTHNFTGNYSSLNFTNFLNTNGTINVVYGALLGLTYLQSGGTLGMFKGIDFNIYDSAPSGNYTMTELIFYNVTSLANKGDWQIGTNYGFYSPDNSSYATTSWGIYNLDRSYFGNKVVFTQTDGNEYIDSLTDGELDLAATTSINGVINGTEQIQLFDGKLVPTTDNDIDLGDSTHAYKNIYADGIVTQNGNLQIYTGSKTLTDGSATGFVDIAIATGEFLGGEIIYSIYATDTTDFQSHTGSVVFNAINKATTVTSDIEETYLPAAESEVVSAGLLTDAWTITNGAGKITINANVDSSLDSSVVLKYTIILHSINTITPL